MVCALLLCYLCDLYCFCCSFLSRVSAVAAAVDNDDEVDKKNGGNNVVVI